MSTDLLRFVSLLAPPTKVGVGPLAMLPGAWLTWELYKWWRRRELAGCRQDLGELANRARDAQERGDRAEANRLTEEILQTYVRCRVEPFGMQRELDKVSGFSLFSAWYTIWNGRAWLNARKLSPGGAEDWHVTQLEAMGLAQKPGQSLANISLWRWNGKTWTRVA